MSGRTILASACLGALLLTSVSGCRSSAPATLTLATGEVLRGSATTSLNGQFYVTGPRTNCSGTYEGRNVGGVALSFGRKATVTAQCSNGTTGTSEDPLYDARRAQLSFGDGSKAVLTLGE